MVLAAAIRVPALVSVMLTAMVQEHERGLGNWQAEWETLPEICMIVSGALSQTLQLMDALEVHAENMARNLEITHGLILAEAVSFALAKRVGKQKAHHVVELASRHAVRDRVLFRDALMADAEVTAHLSSEEIEHLLDPRNYLGSAAKMIHNVLAARDGLSPNESNTDREK